MKLTKYLIIFSLLRISTVWAGSMKFFPATGNLGMYCTYSGEVHVDTTADSVSSLDTRIFVNNLQVHSFTGLLGSGTFTHLGTLGHSLMAVTYPWASYLSNSAYRYVNWYASDSDHLLNLGDAPLFGYLFSSTGTDISGSLDLYYIAGENFDDSNMQSSIVNGMADVLDDVNSGSYLFAPQPCILDIDAPIFTGYTDALSYNLDTLASGLFFTIADYTGNHIVGYNTTEHYRFQAGIPGTGNLGNYVPVSAGSGIDNQGGVNSGTITVYLSGITNITSGNLLTPTTFTLADLDCNFAYAGPGYPLTWNQHTRGYSCSLSLTGLTFDASQVVQVIISGADLPNVNGDTHTGFVAFTFSYVQSGTFFDLKVYPGSRPGGDYSNIGTLKFYDSLTKTLITSGLVTTDNLGLATVEFDHLTNGNYFVVYKGQSHLASYLSGVSITVGSLIPLNFTTGSNLFNTQNQSISQNDGYQRQIAGDLKSTADIYDYTVNGNDIAILTMSGFIDSGIDVLDPKNLNADTAINVSDISVIGVNFQLKDPFHSTYSGEKFTF